MYKSINKFVILSVVLLSLTASPASMAQKKKRVSSKSSSPMAYASFGLGFLDPTLDNYGSELGWGIRGGFYLETARTGNPMSFGLSITQYSTEFSKARAGFNYADIEPKLMLIMGEVNYFFLNPRSGFYAGPRVGIVREDIEVTVVSNPAGTVPNADDNQFGVGFQLGFNQEINEQFSWGSEFNLTKVLDTIDSMDDYSIMNIMFNVTLHI